MLRVLSVVDGFGWSGTKEQVYLLARELKKRGVDVELALAYQNKEMVEKLSPYGVVFWFFENHTKFNRLNPANYLRLYRIIKENNYHVVIANSPHAYDYVRLVYPFLKNKPKLVVVKRSARLPNRLSLKLKYAYADVVVGVSKAVVKSLASAGFPEHKLYVIPSAIDLERFYPNREKGLSIRKQLNIPTDAKVFVNVANWNPPVKGQDMLIKTFSELNCSNCYLLLVGSLTDTEGNKLAKAYSVEKRVIGVGFRENPEDYINAGDYYVMSSYLEGLPNALLQAMACEKVVIATKAGGVEEFLKDGFNGFSVNVGDFNALRQKMEIVLKLSPEEYHQIGKRARETAMNFTPERTCQEYINLFQKLLGIK
ncbi:MAG: glycosyltransferase [Thermocrinis sp.]|nr:glycosyltransferase [Thermocrinis sp.]